MVYTKTSHAALGSLSSHPEVLHPTFSRIRESYYASPNLTARPQYWVLKLLTQDNTQDLQLVRHGLNS